MKIGQAARQAGVNVQSLRYYERRGLVPPPERLDSGYRLYTPEEVRKVKFIKNAQKLGFALKEVEDLLELRVSRRAQCGRVQRKAGARLRDVESKIEKLKILRRVLKDLVRTCKRRGTTDHCPILRSLEDGNGGGNGKEDI